MIDEPENYNSKYPWIECIKIQKGKVDYLEETPSHFSADTFFPLDLFGFKKATSGLENPTKTEKLSEFLDSPYYNYVEEYKGVFDPESTGLFWDYELYEDHNVLKINDLYYKINTRDLDPLLERITPKA
ncbi:hypothetical protein [Persicobacter diffluens]|uniref:hypothetical protein n=1 Tax=Persicobacter diffluens TaxID=981 RepID=UPI0030C67120